MSDMNEQVRVLEERVAKLERQVEVLMKRAGRSSSPARGAREYRDRYDSLDYPDR